MAMNFPRNLLLRVALSSLVLLTGTAFADENEAGEHPSNGAAAEKILFKPISEIGPSIQIEAGELPRDRSEELFHSPQPYGRGALNRLAWPEVEFMWEAPEFLHQPTYFDELPLESYGQTSSRVLQPALSGIHFFGHTALMPYKMLIENPYGYISSLGYYRMGSPAPPLREKLRWGIDPRWLHPSGYWLHH